MPESENLPAEPAPPSPLGPSPRVREAIGVFRDGADGKLSREQVESVVAKTRRGIRAAAPLSAEVAIEIANDETVSPGTRLKAAMFLLQGGGVTQIGVAVTEAERRKIDAEMEGMRASGAEYVSLQIHKDAGIAPVALIDVAKP